MARQLLDAYFADPAPTGGLESVLAILEEPADAN